VPVELAAVAPPPRNERYQPASRQQSYRGWVLHGQEPSLRRSDEQRSSLVRDNRSNPAFGFLDPIPIPVRRHKRVLCQLLRQRRTPRQHMSYGQNGPVFPPVERLKRFPNLHHRQVGCLRRGLSRNDLWSLDLAPHPIRRIEPGIRLLACGRTYPVSRAASKYLAAVTLAPPIRARSTPLAPPFLRPTRPDR